MIEGVVNCFNPSSDYVCRLIQAIYFFWFKLENDIEGRKRMGYFFFFPMVFKVKILTTMILGLSRECYVVCKEFRN